jgi:hypothetical protein
MKINNFADNLHSKLGRWQLPESMFNMMANGLQKCVLTEKAFYCTRSTVQTPQNNVLPTRLGLTT